MPTPMRAAASIREVLGEAGQSGHRRPQCQAYGHQAAAVPAVGEAPERDTEQSVEDREGGAVKEADLRVVELEVGLDALREDGDDLPVDEIEDVDDDEQEQRVPGVARTRAVVLGRRLIGSSVIARALPTHLDKDDGAEQKRKFVHIVVQRGESHVAFEVLAVVSGSCRLRSDGAARRARVARRTSFRAAVPCSAPSACSASRPA